MSMTPKPMSDIEKVYANSGDVQYYPKVGDVVKVYYKAIPDDVIEGIKQQFGSRYQEVIDVHDYKIRLKSDPYVVWRPSWFDLYARDSCVIKLKVGPPEPKNNDGRDFCFWCGVKTKKIQGFNSEYDVCDRCGK